jgi:hypothetical protein
MGVQKHYQKRFTKKKRVEKFLQKNRPKIQNRFFPRFFYRVVGRFSARGVQEHHFFFNRQNESYPRFFWPLTHPPTTGVADLFFLLFGGLWRPLGPWCLVRGRSFGFPRVGGVAWAARGLGRGSGRIDTV